MASIISNGFEVYGTADGKVFVARPVGGEWAEPADTADEALAICQQANKPHGYWRFSADHTFSITWTLMEKGLHQGTHYTLPKTYTKRRAGSLDCLVPTTLDAQKRIAEVMWDGFQNVVRYLEGTYA